MPKKTHARPEPKAASSARKAAAPAPAAKKPSPTAKPVPSAKPPLKPAPKPTPKAESKPAVAKPESKKPSHPPAAPAPKAPAAPAPKPPVKPAAETSAKRKTSVERSKIVRKTPTFVAFSYEEALEIARANASRAAAVTESIPGKAGAAAARKAVDGAHVPKTEARSVGAASLADILGFNPRKGPKVDEDERKVPDKWKRHYKLLVELRSHIKEGLALHTEDTLMKSAKDDSGDLSGYSQHMADAGTESFDRDFALSLVANEQEALAEIEAAIKRILDGSYGVCELTQQPIERERLLAVPFTRYCKDSQAEVERLKKLRHLRGGVVGDAEDEEGGGEEDSED